MRKNGDFDNSALAFDDFFQYFIALYSLQGENSFSIPRFKKFMNKYYKDSYKILSNLEGSIKSLEEKGLVKRIEYDCLSIINKKAFQDFAANNLVYLEKIANIVKLYRDFEAKEIDRLYDLMIDQEAIDMYRERERQEMEKEYLAHIRFHR